MKKETKIHQFDPVIYPVKLWIADQFDAELIKNTFYYGDNIDVVLNEKEAMVCSSFNKVVTEKETSKYGFLITMREKKLLTVGMIAHEATHIARFIWDYIEEGGTGIEADAYLVGWIADCIEKVRSEK